MVDPDPDLIYAKRKIAREQASSSRHETVASTSTNASSTYVSQRQGNTKIKVNFPTSGWGNSLQKMPFLSRAEMDKFVALTGKSLGCAGKKSVPSGLKKATTFVKDEYLKDIESCSDQRYFFYALQMLSLLSKERSAS